MKLARIFSFAAVATLAAMNCFSAELTLLGTDPANASSMSGAGTPAKWSDNSKAAVAGNDYIIDNEYKIRTPNNTASYTFLGDKLILRNGSVLNKLADNTTLTIQHLQVAENGLGQVSAASENCHYSYAGSDWQVLAGGTLQFTINANAANQLRYAYVGATITGTGTIKTVDTAQNGTGSEIGFTGNLTGFTGKLDLEMLSGKSLCTFANQTAWPGNPASATADGVKLANVILKFSDNVLSGVTRGFQIGSGVTIYVEAGKTVTINGPIAAASGFTKTGAGTLRLNGDVSSVDKSKVTVSAGSVQYLHQGILVEGEPGEYGNAGYGLANAQVGDVLTAPESVIIDASTKAFCQGFKVYRLDASINWVEDTASSGSGRSYTVTATDLATSVRLVWRWIIVKDATDTTVGKISLPAGYQAVEWIQSDGNQWLDTGVHPDNTTSVEMHFGKVTYENGKAFFGQNWSSSMYLFNMQSSKFYFHGSSTSLINVEANKNYFVTVTTDGKLKIGVEGGDTTNSYTVSLSTDGSKNMGLFGCITDHSRNSKFRLYSFKIWKSGSPVRDFVPCRETSGSERIGLYDVVGNKFYPNQGSGAFTHGEDLFNPAAEFLVSGTPADYSANSLPIYGIVSGFTQGDTWTFTAPADWIMVNDRQRTRCAGWKLYTWNGSDFVQTSASTSENKCACAYTRGATGGKLEWLWEYEYLYTAAVSGEGEVTTTVPSGWYSSEASATLTATAASGYKFAGWAGEVPAADKNSNPVTVTIGTGPFTATAIFEADVPQTAVYLKADATGGETGTSWANAFTSVSNALADAEAKNLPIYAAQGVYIIKSGYEFCPTKSGWKLYGGFPGLSMDETVNDRDPDAYQTIFTGDRTLDDVWQHFDTNSSYSVTYTVTTEPVIKNGRVNMPPAFTGMWDGYVPQINGTDSTAAMLISYNGTLDGITFTGFSNSANTGTSSSMTSNPGGVVNMAKTNPGGTIANCRFYGIRSGLGGIYCRGATTITNCVFAYCFGANRGTCISTHNSAPTVSNCTFLSCLRTNAGGSTSILNGWGGSFNVYNSTFARCALAQGSSYQTMYGADSNIAGGENGGGIFYDCAVSNCYTAGSTANGATMFQGRGTFQFVRVHFADNLCEVKPTAGKAFCMMGQTVDTDKPRRPYESCSFERNIIRARTVAATAGTYALSIVGNNVKGADSTLLNCSFIDNVAETLVDVPGVTPILCRGVLTYSGATDWNAETGIANSFFHGPAMPGVYDVVQYGDSHVKPLNIVNSVFTASGEAQITPIYADVPALVKVVDTTIQNKLSTDGEAITYQGLAYDKVPFVREVVGKFGRFALRPDAITPDLASACPVSTNHTSTPISWVFSNRWEGAWTLLNSKSGNNDSGNWKTRPVTDAERIARPANAIRRGPLQTATDNAENGASIVLRRDPFAAGTFDSEAVQSVATGTEIAPVTATSANAALYTFDGWYNENGEKLYANTQLEGTFPAGTTVLTAKFTAPQVNVTFSLDGKGVFTANNASTITIPCTPGDIFPEIPAYTMAEGWYSFGFTTPQFVGSDPIVFTADTVETSVRYIHVVPESEAPLVQDGTTWQTAYTNIATAYADAGKYRGEVWIKKGRYLVTSPITILPNVTIRGGFAGTETTPEEADPEENESIITGDVNGDDYWRPDNNSGSLADNPVWTLDNGTWIFNEPAIDYSKKTYWRPSGNLSDNASTFLVNISGVATNSAVAGITMTGFKSSVIVSSSGMANGFILRDCRILANNGNAGGGENMTGAIMITGSGFIIDNCVFNGNVDVIAVNSSASTKLLVRDSSFKYSVADGGCAAIRTLGSSFLVMTNCWLYRNWQGSAGWQGASALSFRSSGTHIVDSCLFEENRNTGDSHGTICFSSGSSNAKITRCKFIGNRVNNSGDYESSHSCGIAYYNGAGAVLVKDSLFEANYAYASTSVTNNYPTTAVSAYGGSTTVINCSFVANTNKASSAASWNTAGTIAGSVSVGIVNCSFRDSVIEGDNAAEINVNGTPTFGIVNCAFDTTFNPETYRPFRSVSSTQQISLANVYARNFNDAAFANLASNGYCTNVWTAGTYAFPKNAAEKDGVKSQPVVSRFARKACPVWLDGYTVYFRDELTNPAKPWRKAHDRSSFSATVTGITVDTPTAPDAFGAARRFYPRPSALGPANVSDSFKLILR